MTGVLTCALPIFASDAREAGEDTFAYGALYQLERDRAAAAERQLPKDWPKADRGRLAG